MNLCNTLTPRVVVGIFVEHKVSVLPLNICFSFIISFSCLQNFIHNCEISCGRLVNCFRWYLDIVLKCREWFRRYRIIYLKITVLLLKWSRFLLGKKYRYFTSVVYLRVSINIISFWEFINGKSMLSVLSTAGATATWCLYQRQLADPPLIWSGGRMLFAPFLFIDVHSIGIKNVEICSPYLRSSK